MFGFLTKTIYRKIFLLILFVSIVPTTVGILQTYLGNLVAMDAMLGDYLQERIIKVGGELDRVLERKINALLDMKTNPRLISLLDSIELPASTRANVQELASPSPSLVLSQKLNQALANTPLQNEHILVFNLNGELLIANTPEVQVSFNNFSWWTQITQLANTEVLIAERFLQLIPSKGIIQEADSKTRAWVFIFTPYYEFRTTTPFPKAVLATVFSFDELMDPITMKMGGSETAYTILYSDVGRILYPATQSSLSEKELSQLLSEKHKLSGWFGRRTAGGYQIFAYMPLAFLSAKARGRNITNQWYLLQGMDVSDIKAFTSMIFWRSSLISFGLVFIFCLLGLYISRRMVMPLKQLNRSVRNIAKGDFSTRVNVTTNDEIGILAANYNIMAEKLNRTYNELAEKIVEIDRKAKQISLINDITRAINSELDLNETFRIITSEMQKLVKFDRLSICLPATEEECAEFVFVWPEERQRLTKGSLIPLQGSNIGYAMTTGEIVIKEDIAQTKDAIEEPVLATDGIRSLIVLPLKSKSRIIGTLNLASTEPNQYGTAEEELLLQISEALAVAIEHSRLYTRISRFAEELEEKVKERTQDLERAQQKLIQTEKMVALGRLAANVAHEINNPLQIIKNYIRVISMHIEKARRQNKVEDATPLCTQELKIINDELDRIARIIRGLLDFYQTPEQRSIPVKINQEISNLIQLMEKVLNTKRIDVVLRLNEAVPTILSSPDLIRQVLLNIIRNAEDAMEEKGGTLIIETDVKSELVAGMLQKKIIVYIADTGCGIPPQFMSKIFDPFFSTKKAEKGGTGLGLSVSYSIMRSLGGDIEIQSEVGKGTTVKLEFPIVAPAEAVGS